jgi:hypothetical protein
MEFLIDILLEALVEGHAGKLQTDTGEKGGIQVSILEFLKKFINLKIRLACIETYDF